MDDSLITISPPGRGLDPGLLRAPGGFLWWYLDLVDERGDGLVLIWSFGLPFLPGYTESARKGCAPPAAARPSLNLSIYRDGRLDFYLLREFERRRAEWSPDQDRWRIGKSEIRRTVDEEHVRLDIALDCAVAGCAERLTGTIASQGVTRRPASGESTSEHGPVHHDWSPQTGPAVGRADLKQGRRHWQLSGRAYHDRNGGAHPLDALGIDLWIWGRAPLEDRELIYYLLWDEANNAPTCLGMTIDRDGTTRYVDDLRVVRRGRRRNLGGLRWWEALELHRGESLWARIRHLEGVDSGPFYMRYVTEVTGADGESVIGIGELCYPDRVDLDRHRPLVRMRVDRPDGANSMWLPLFCGPKEGRLLRLVSSWFGGGSR